MREEGRSERFRALLASETEGAEEGGQILEAENAPQPTAHEETGSSVPQLHGV